MRATFLAKAVLALVLVACAAPALAADTDIVITEIMQNPLVLADTDGEWFELHNTGATPVDIEGWTVKDDGTNTFTIASGGPLPVPAGGYVVLARNATAMAGQGVTVFYQYGGTGTFDIGNSDDEIVLLNTSLVEIDRVMYDGGAAVARPQRRLDDVGRGLGRQQRRRQLEHLDRGLRRRRQGHPRRAQRRRAPAAAGGQQRDPPAHPARARRDGDRHRRRHRQRRHRHRRHPVRAAQRRRLPGHGHGQHRRRRLHRHHRRGPAGRRGGLLRLRHRQRRPDRRQPRRRTRHLLQLRGGAAGDHAHRHHPRRQRRLRRHPGHGAGPGLHPRRLQGRRRERLGLPAGRQRPRAERVRHVVQHRRRPAQRHLGHRRGDRPPGLVHHHGRDHQLRGHDDHDGQRGADARDPGHRRSGRARQRGHLHRGRRPDHRHRHHRRHQPRPQRDHRRRLRARGPAHRRRRGR